MDIDTNLYSRQIGTFGMEMMGKLMQLKVLISGLRGLGVETAKNLILAGPHTVVVHDDNLVSITDLGSNFYLSESDVGARTRAEASAGKLQELNPHVHVSSYQGELTNDFILNFDVVCLTETDLAHIVRINHFCRTNGQKRIGFLTSEAWGASGHLFVDFGQDFTSFDKDGENPQSFIISNITKSSPGIITVHEDKRHNFQDGDFVKFKEVEGMSELNSLPAVPIKFISPFSFSIQDTSKFSEYTRQGIVEQVKVPTSFNFRSFEETLSSPATNENPLIVTDYGKFGRPEQLHLACWALREFQAKYGHLPQLLSHEQAGQVFAIAKEINDKQKTEKKFCLENVEEEVVRNLSLFSRAQVSPVASFWGGIVAQEIVKFTGKYTPVQQWLHIDFFEIINQNAEKVLRGTRYDDQIAIIGNEVHEKIAAGKSLLVGAGALGCEFLKLFALMGVSVNGGEVVVTDDDSIEISNLSRQFLFRRNDVGHSKSERAAIAARGMNGAFNVITKQDRVSQDNEHIFNDEFWNSRDFVINAVDNVKARLYVDSRCVWYEKPLLESGTLGTKANTQVCIPHKTQSYGDSQDPPEESIPMCTLKNFPHAIEHCIEWAKDEFHGVFCETPQDVNKYLENPIHYLTSLSSSGNSTEQKEKLQKIKSYITLLKNATFEECVKLSREALQENFHNQIVQLLHNFPIDSTTKEGTPFWSGPKRAPTPANFDINDPVHLEYILSGSNLMASIIGLPQQRDLNTIKSILLKIPIKPFKPKSVIIQSDDSLQLQDLNQDDQMLSALVQELKVPDPSLSHLRLAPVVFEKDDDSNLHIDHITQAANLRARNYNIPETDQQKTKMIAGKIIPAIATTTAMIAGAVAVELYKLHFQTSIEKFKNTFANLAINTILFSEPLPPLTIKSTDRDPITKAPVKAYPEGFSTWQKLKVAGPLTLQGLLDAIFNEHRLKTRVVSCGKTLLFNGYLANVANAGRLGKILHLLYEEVSGEKIRFGRRDLALQISCEEEDGTEVEVPVVRYTF